MDGCGMALCALGAEGARTVVASALGGLTRWIAAERRGLRNGAVAVAGGALAGHYLWPVTLWLIGMEETPETVAMAAYVAGTLGISAVRTLGAMVETRARRLRDA